MSLEFPASPTDGQVYDQWIWSDTKGAWQALPLESAKTITADVAPANPDDGDQWFNTVDGTLYIYVVDVDGGQWVESQAPITANGYYSPNYIINGGFDINQRGALGAIGSGYRLDRWFVDVTASCTVTQDSTVVGSRSRYSMKVSANGTGNFYASQSIETLNARQLAGKTVTAQALVASNGPTSDMVMSVSYSTVVDQSPNLAWTTAGSTSQALSTNLTKITTTCTIPSNAQSIRVMFYNASTFTSGQAFYISEAQLEEGTVATTFRRNANSIQGELAACQRYYQQETSTRRDGFKGGADNFRIIIIPFAVEMRVAPTTTQTISGGTYSGNNVITTKFYTPVINAGNTVDERFVTGWTASAEL